MRFNGEKLKSAREERNLSQQELAVLSGVSKGYIALLEADQRNERTGMPVVNNLRKALKKPITFFYSE